jgi:hypothetical protein
VKRIVISDVLYISEWLVYHNNVKAVINEIVSP